MDKDREILAEIGELALEFLLFKEQMRLADTTRKNIRKRCVRGGHCLALEYCKPCSEASEVDAEYAGAKKRSEEVLVKMDKLGDRFVEEAEREAFG